MSIVKMDHKGRFNKTVSFLGELSDLVSLERLYHYGRMGNDALKKATPKRTGLTSKSWHHTVVKKGNTVNIYWFNTNDNHGVYIATLLQNGHVTRDGRWLPGIDYITPAMKPVFKKMKKDLWLEVTK